MYRIVTVLVLTSCHRHRICALVSHYRVYWWCENSFLIFTAGGDCCRSQLGRLDIRLRGIERVLCWCVSLLLEKEKKFISTSNLIPRNTLLLPHCIENEILHHHHPTLDISFQRIELWSRDRNSVQWWQNRAFW